MKLKYTLMHLFVFLFGIHSTQAANVRITDLKRVSETEFSFTLAWEHSWRDSLNYDGVYVFFKGLKTDPETTEYVTIKPENFRAVVLGKDMEFRNLGIGTVIHWSVSGKGKVDDVSVTVKLTEVYKTVAVHAVEMVYVPQGSFFAGDGVSNGSIADASGNPLEINSESEMNQKIVSLNEIHSPDPLIPAGFPKGFAPFWVMKYEISQGQYIAFLNSLTQTQQKNRTQMPPESPAGTYALSPDGTLQNRNGIVVIIPAEGSRPAVYGCNADSSDPPGYLADGPNRACNFLSWADLTAYLDWAGLRPMTELEYEKAGRGSGKLPLAREFAFGTAQVIDANTLIDDGTNIESVTETATDSSGVASHGYAGPWGPLRCGFSARSVPNRLQAGASFYGVFELSGNLWELCVSLAGGTTYEGTSGDGNLTNDGFADLPGLNPDGTGAGYRGGAWLSGILENFRDLALSDRFYAGQAPAFRRHTSGGRGVISAP